MSDHGDTTAAKPESDTGSSTYAEFFAGLLADQEQRKASIEQRGLSVITTAGALATLLFGLVAVITKTDKFKLPATAHGPLGIALVAFVVASLLALLTNLPLWYSNLDPKAFPDIFDRYWGEKGPNAQLRIAVMRARVFTRAQCVNEWKARLLAAAMFSEVVAVIALSLAVRAVLRAA